MFQLSLTQFLCSTSLKPFLSCVCPPAILMFYLLLTCSQQVSTYRSLLAVSLANLGQHLFSNLKKKILEILEKIVAIQLLQVVEGKKMLSVKRCNNTNNDKRV